MRFFLRILEQRYSALFINSSILEHMLSAIDKAPSNIEWDVSDRIFEIVFYRRFLFSNADEARSLMNETIFRYVSK